MFVCQRIEVNRKVMRDSDQRYKAAYPQHGFEHHQLCFRWECLDEHRVEWWIYGNMTALYPKCKDYSCNLDEVSGDG